MQFASWLSQNIYHSIRDTASNITNKFRDTSKFQSDDQQTLDEYGNQRITKIVIFRNKIVGAVGTVIGLVAGEDGNFYHLGMAVTVEKGGQQTVIKVDKESDVNVKVENPLGKPNQTTMEVPLKKSITLNQFLQKAISKYGQFQIFDYDALDGRNCQNFVIDVLTANDLLTKREKDFTLQDLVALKEKSKLGKELTHDIVKGATDLENAISDTSDNIRSFIAHKILR
jgi:hypothetical protein